MRALIFLVLILFSAGFSAEVSAAIPWNDFEDEADRPTDNCSEESLFLFGLGFVFVFGAWKAYGTGEE